MRGWLSFSSAKRLGSTPCTPENGQSYIRWSTMLPGFPCASFPVLVFLDCRQKRPAWPTWKPMHLQPVFDTAQKAEDGRQKAGKKKQRYRARVVGGEVSEDLFRRGLCLPSGTAMTNNDLGRVIDVIHKCEK